MFTIRPATVADLPAINAIYNHYVLTSTCTYQYEPSTEAERRAWFDDHDAKHPIIVAVDPSSPNVVLAWASLGEFHTRCAYQHTVENSVYVHKDHHRQGLARLLMLDLIARARALGHHSIVALISADQTPSVLLHESLGFAKAAHLQQVGYKFDRWLDVVYYQLML